jgi:hypothetical protein
VARREIRGRKRGLEVQLADWAGELVDLAVGVQVSEASTRIIPASK